MRRWLPLTAIIVADLASPLAAQTIEKELVATISSAAIEHGVVSELAWDGGTLLIQSAVMGANGQLSARYHAVPGPRMELRHLTVAPPGAERYWQMKASRMSPTGLGRITDRRDAKMPMYGIGSQERRMLDAVDMGGTDVTHELRLGHLSLHNRHQSEPPYDGEVWSWSPPMLNRIAYVDGKGDLWIARADGAGSERLARGSFTLPAWSEDGRLLAVVERKEGGARWEVSVIHLPDKFRKQP